MNAYMYVFVPCVFILEHPVGLASFSTTLSACWLLTALAGITQLAWIYCGPGSGQEAGSSSARDGSSFGHEAWF